VLVRFRLRCEHMNCWHALAEEGHGTPHCTDTTGLEADLTHCSHAGALRISCSQPQARTLHTWPGEPLTAPSTAVTFEAGATLVSATASLLTTTPLLISLKAAGLMLMAVCACACEWVWVGRCVRACMFAYLCASVHICV